MKKLVKGIIGVMICLTVLEGGIQLNEKIDQTLAKKIIEQEIARFEPA